MTNNLKQKIDELLYEKYGNDISKNNYFGFMTILNCSKKPDIIQLMHDMRNFIKVNFDSTTMTTNEIFYIIYNNISEIPKCIICDNSVSFVSIFKGYKKYCCIRCGSLDPEQQRKRRNACVEKYNVTHPSKSEHIKKKKRETCRKNFGVDYPMQSKLVMDKSLETMNIKYGCHVTQDKIIRQRQLQTLFSHYEVDNPSKSEIIKERKRQTNLKNHGVDWYGMSEESKERNKMRAYSRLTSYDDFKVDFSFEEYNGCLYNNQYPFICNTCDTKFMERIADGFEPKCPTCYPGNVSIAEKEICDFCKIYYPNLIENDRTILEGKELDIYIPDLKFAIEFNGLYWHSEIAGCNNNHHINKTLKAEENGIKLIHIFEDEWRDKEDIVKSMISYRLGKISKSVYARKCEIGIEDCSTSKVFFNNNHIQGYVPSSMTLSLIYNFEPVAMLSFGKSRYNKNYEWEILRFCNKLNTNVIGGLSKLFKHFVKKYMPKSIITYADRRYGEGLGYLNCGFEYKHCSKPNYYYLNNGSRESRIKYQKHKLNKLLKNFDPNLTEWENMKNDGRNRIWDCGNNMYTWENVVNGN